LFADCFCVPRLLRRYGLPGHSVAGDRITSSSELVEIGSFSKPPIFPRADPPKTWPGA
jgi:hypothetical protein